MLMMRTVHSAEATLTGAVPTATHQNKGITTNQGRPMMYDKAELIEAKKYWDALAMVLRSKFRADGTTLPLEGPIGLTLLVGFRRSTDSDPAAGEPHLKKPDCSNIMKTAEDALVRMGVIRDDSLVVSTTTMKCWAELGFSTIIVKSLERARP